MELWDAIHGRRSIRKFKPEPVPRPLLEALIKKAMWAPSAMNTQPWKFIVLTGQKRQALIDISCRALAQLDIRLRALFNEKMRTFIHGYFKDFGGAPAIVVVLTAVPEHEVYLAGNYQASAAALYNLLLLAYEAGLGTCWMTGPLWVEKELLDFLGYPDWRLVGLTPIGYPDQTPPVPPRKHEEILWLDD